MIYIKKSTTADTRTCDWSKVTKSDLILSTRQYISDVQKALDYFVGRLRICAENHDHTKLSHIDMFHKDFQTGFKTQLWYQMHKAIERHHIAVPEGRRHDINLIDVLEYISDCVMAGMGRSGSVYDLELPDDVLQTTFKNTVELLKSQVVIEEQGDE
jgi:hypothetical protein